MRSGEFNIEGDEGLYENLKKIVSRVSNHATFYLFEDGWCWISESTSFVTVSGLTVSVYFKVNDKSESKYAGRVAIVAAGGGVGFMGLNYGSEIRAIKRT